MPALEATTVSEQARALAERAGLRIREDLGVVWVRGDDRESWLNGQLTNDIRKLPAGAGLYSLAINLRGKIMADVWVLAKADEFGLIVPKAVQTALIENLERYIIMEDVTLVVDADARVVSVLGPNAQTLVARVPTAVANAFNCDELGAGGVYVVSNAAQAPALVDSLLAHGGELGAVLVSEAGHELARLRAGRPRFGHDFDDTTYPQEAGLKGALSFEKGCYLGQEVVCTLENRGRLTRKLCLIKGEPGVLATGAISGTELLAGDGQVCGRLTSGMIDPDDARSVALGFVKRAHAVAGELLHAASTAWCVERSLDDSD